MKGTICIIWWSRRDSHLVLITWHNMCDLFRVPLETRDGPLRVSATRITVKLFETQRLLMKPPATLAGLTTSSPLISAGAPLQDITTSLECMSTDHPYNNFLNTGSCERQLTYFFNENTSVLHSFWIRVFKTLQPY